jgi:hypothetical protein
VPIVVRDVSPKLLVNANVPFPPTVFFTTVMDPPGAAVLVLVNVQVVVAPATTVIAAGVPLVQLALVCVQPVGTVSLTLKLLPGVRLLIVWLAVPPIVVREVSPKRAGERERAVPAHRVLHYRIDPVWVAWVLRNVHVVVAPATTVMAAGVPFVQLALV